MHFMVAYLELSKECEGRSCRRWLVVNKRSLTSLLKSELLAWGHVVRKFGELITQTVQQFEYAVHGRHCATVCHEAWSSTDGWH